MKEKIVSQEITQELRQAYLDYAMSVIVSRALPDARDGLKPVQRRILYTMKELGLWAREKFVKCANIVGNVLARYHPHGDQAVYDALVRMAQDFSLRYPLVWGQGNFGCFTKDTKVKLTDGRSINFEELIKEQRQGKRHWTFTFNHQTKKIEIAEIKNPRLTRRNEKIMEVILDNGEKIRCTLDHLFMLRDGTYKQAKDLKPGDSLMPLYIKAYDGKEDQNLKGYEMVYQPMENKWEFIHRLADEWNLKNGVYKKSAGKIRHHIDFNKLNNNPDNILRIKWEDHWKYHKEIASERHRSDPEYAKKIAEGRRKFWAKKENKIFRAKLQSERNKRMWRDPLYRTRWIEARKKIWQDLEYKEFMRKVSSKNLKRLWKRKDFRELLSKLKSQELKLKWKDENYRKYWEEKMREISLKIWSNPKHRDYISHLMKEKFKDPEQREKQSKIAKALWQNPEYRAKFSPDHFSKMAKKLWENPKIREFHREKARKQWHNQKFRKKFIAGVIAANRRRLEENPNFMKELTQKAKISLHKNWQDPSYKEKVIRSKILGYVYSLLKKYKKVTTEVYEKERTNNGIPKIANALNYFNNFSEILTEAKKYNHKVIKTRILRKREDVYDLTIEPWHNFALAAGIFVHNSIDGDPPAQMRYSESKLTKIAEEMLVDIDKETVDFRPNYDNTRKEPVVLPAKIPNLIVNGSLGIAVGMATSIPPHNLTEVMSAIKFLIKKPNAEIEEILQYIKGPDFPTGGTIYGGEKLKEVYSEGKGGITLAGDVLIERTRKERLIITSIPWQVNKAELVKEIANLALEKVLPDIKDVRDESSREGVRIVIETRPGANLEKLKENLYRLTSLSKTFYFNLIALENGIQPKLFSLKELLLSWIYHRREVIKRRTKFDLEKNKERVHLLEGFDKALENLDKVINTIKRSKDRQDALKNLMEKFKLTQKQADAILEMPLRTLTQMERHKILEELKERRSIIKELEEILRSAKKIDEIIISEADEIIKNYPSERLTKIVSEEKVFETKEIIPEEKVWLIIDQKNLVSLTPIDKFNLDKVLKNQNLPKILKPVSTKDKLILVSKLGKVYNIPVANFYHSAKYLESQIILDKNDEILEIIIEEKAKYLILIFENGFGKKMKLEDCLTNRKTGVSTAKNEVVSAFLINGGETIGTLSESGNILLFKENLPVQGRSAKGVKIMKLKNEKIIKAFLKESNNLLLIFDQGFYKKIDLKEIKVQNRGTKGVKLFENKYGKLLLAKTIKDEKEIVISDDKLKRIGMKELPTLRRTQSAKKIDNLNLINSILLI